MPPATQSPLIARDHRNAVGPHLTGKPAEIGHRLVEAHGERTSPGGEVRPGTKGTSPHARQHDRAGCRVALGVGDRSPDAGNDARVDRVAALLAIDPDPERPATLLRPDFGLLFGHYPVSYQYDFGRPSSRSARKQRIISRDTGASCVATISRK